MSQPKRNRYSDEFKAEALKLAEKTSAAREPGIHESQIYGWRSAAKKKTGVSQRASERAAKNARLKRQMAEREEELAISGSV